MEPNTRSMACRFRCRASINMLECWCAAAAAFALIECTVDGVPDPAGQVGGYQQTVMAPASRVDFATLCLPPCATVVSTRKAICQRGRVPGYGCEAPTCGSLSL
jgi:hypothetical protein